ncbi:hypothetical protein CsSME_00014124 [Camellia sinensis var. sinensis]
MYINTVPLLQSHQNTLPTSPIYVGVSVPLSRSLSLSLSLSTLALLRPSALRVLRSRSVGEYCWQGFSAKGY